MTHYFFCQIHVCTIVFQQSIKYASHLVIWGGFLSPSHLWYAILSQTGALSALEFILFPFGYSWVTWLILVVKMTVFGVT